MKPSGKIFLKLGGSLITDKTRPLTARTDTITRLAKEIAAAISQNPELRLLLGHGSGSFGHVPAKQFSTRQGVHTAEQWQSFAIVWYAAASLNHLVLDSLHDAGLPAMAFPPSAVAIAEDGQVFTWDLTPLQLALQAGLLPVVYGDVAFDARRGGTILSTEDLFTYLAPKLKPQRVLLAGLEPGVWQDYPLCTRLIKEITQENLDEVMSSLDGSAGTDVTGGMASKVLQSLALVQESPGLEVEIFSAEQPGSLERALAGGHVGTRIHAIESG